MINDILVTCYMFPHTERSVSGSLFCPMVSSAIPVQYDILSALKEVLMAARAYLFSIILLNSHSY